MDKANDNQAKHILAEAQAEAYFGNYTSALKHLQQATFPVGSALHIEASMITYIGNRGTGQLEEADEALIEFERSTPLGSKFAEFRLSMARQVMTHFSDPDTAAGLIENYEPDSRRLAELQDLLFMIAVSRSQISAEEILQYLGTTKDFGPTEDWIAAFLIQKEGSPETLQLIIDSLDQLQLRAPVYRDAIEHRIAYARDKLGANGTP